MANALRIPVTKYHSILKKQTHLCTQTVESDTWKVMVTSELQNGDLHLFAYVCSTVSIASALSLQPRQLHQVRTLTDSISKGGLVQVRRPTAPTAGTNHPSEFWSGPLPSHLAGTHVPLPSLSHILLHCQYRC